MIITTWWRESREWGEANYFVTPLDPRDNTLHVIQVYGSVDVYGHPGVLSRFVRADESIRGGRISPRRAP